MSPSRPTSTSMSLRGGDACADHSVVAAAAPSATESTATRPRASPRANRRTPRSGVSFSFFPRTSATETIAAPEGSTNRFARHTQPESVSPRERGSGSGSLGSFVLRCRSAVGTRASCKAPRSVPTNTTPGDARHTARGTSRPFFSSSSFSRGVASAVNVSSLPSHAFPTPLSPRAVPPRDPASCACSYSERSQSLMLASAPAVTRVSAPRGFRTVAHRHTPRPRCPRSVATGSSFSFLETSPF
mmetsp:Transcript_2056/g.8111  ORF Transcript_2056/g.8111 Transcript_2056/m.8111 type:complete len:244 (-) Transcript_2056:232-963(-)